MTWFNPKTWFQKVHAGNKVYIATDPNQPHVGLSVFTEDRGASASFCLEDISLGAAKINLCGKVIDWEKVPVKYIASLKTGGTVTIPLDRLKSLLR